MISACSESILHTMTWCAMQMAKRAPSRATATADTCDFSWPISAEKHGDSTTEALGFFFIFWAAAEEEEVGEDGVLFAPATVLMMEEKRSPA